jgi:hypothetical protein
MQYLNIVCVIIINMYQSLRSNTTTIGGSVKYYSPICDNSSSIVDYLNRSPWWWCSTKMKSTCVIEKYLVAA